MIPVVLSGGSGTRLWPVSRQSHPKQFCDLLDEAHGQTLFANTVRRLQPLGSPWTVTVRELKVLTERSLASLGVPLSQVVYEPFGRNTAPAIALLCRVFELRGMGREVAGIFPADHVIENEEAFHRAVRLGASIAEQGQIVTLGVVPTYPATGYGYIETSGAFSAAGGLRAIGFREKPSAAVAGDFIARGGFFWNAGMFIFRVDTMIALLQEHAPEVWSGFAGLCADLSNLEDIYHSVKGISIDYAVMEKLSSHVCIPCDFPWSDLGSWDSYAEFVERSGAAGVSAGIAGAPIEVDAKGNFVFPSREKVYSVIGADDLLVVDTDDALLISRRGSSELVKDVVEQLKKSGDKRASEHVFEVRPWGRFEILRDTAEFKSKVIDVNPGAQISYQSHTKRAEHWIVVKGRGEVILDDRTLPASPGVHINIPVGAKHRIRNLGTEVLQFVEVQLGSYFGEDDIVRYDDAYGRK